MTTQRLEAFKSYIRAQGWLWKAGKPIPYGEQLIIIAGNDQVTLDFYPKRGRMVVGGPDSLLKSAVQAWINSDDEGAVGGPGIIPPPHIGLDEAGKGDWFGPLVVAAVAVDATTAPRLQQAGVRDSKLLGGVVLVRLAQEIERIVPAQQRHIWSIAPAQYNRLYAQHNNINLLLAAAYAEVAAQVWRNTFTDTIVCDQFSQRADRLDQAFARQQLPRPIQQHHAEESSIAVAAASILAGASFVAALAQLAGGAGLDQPLPRGATAVAELEQAARTIITRQGTDALGSFVKLNFKPVQDLLRRVEQGQ